MTWVNDVRPAARDHAGMLDIPAIGARADDATRDWVNGTVLQLEREAARSADTHGHAVVDASSGSTAICEAWFGRLPGVPFTAVLPGRHRAGQAARQALRRLVGNQPRGLPAAGRRDAAA